jgi:hypothetical protein
MRRRPLFTLDDEQHARVGDCVRKDGLSLPPDRLERFIGGIEASISHFRATPPEGSLRDAHNALRVLRMLAHEDDPPIGQLKRRLALLPPAAREYIDRRASIVMQRLGVDLDRTQSPAPRLLGCLTFSRAGCPPVGSRGLNTLR